MNLVKRNQKLHNPDSPLLVGDVNDSDVVREVNEPSYIETDTKVVPVMRTFQSTLLTKDNWVKLKTLHPALLYRN